MKRTKKGRPSKSDLAAAQANPSAAEECELRRSGRRRNVRYTFDFDDYLDDEEYFFVEEEEDERRREKKIKLLLKLHSSKTTSDSPSYRRHEMLSLASSLSSDDDADYGDDDEGDGDGDDKGLKKRKVDSCGIEGEDNEIDSGKGDSDDEDDNYGRINDEVKEKGQEGTNEVDYAPGGEFTSECPLPDKKILELILHKLQKKDIYGVYAEPVDPEELPDYHDLIKNPMDFSTIRRKLSNGSYATLEKFESDVFLLCSNAMQYNEPDTIYHKQARSIQDLAKRKFQKLRADNERLENQMKSEQKPKPVSVFKKQIPRQTSRTFQEPIGCDTQNGSNVRQADVIEKASSLDVLVEGNRFVIDTSVDKLGESLAERGPLLRYGRKAPTQDESRATNSIGSQPNASSDSAFSTFDRETKQLIPVGLHVEHAYARSLSRFAGTLGPVAWRVASKRIEQILPPGTKFGRGWVGDFEPLPTPVQIPDNCNIESDFIVKPRHTDKPSKHKNFANPVASGDSCISVLPLEGKLKFTNPALSEVTTSSSEHRFREEPSIWESSLDGKASFSFSKGTDISGSTISRFLHSSPQMSHLVESSKKVMKPVEVIGPSSANHSSAQLGMERQVFNKAAAPMPNISKMVSVDRSPLPSTSFNHSNISGVAFGSLQTDNPLLNGRAANCAAVSSKEPCFGSEMNKVGPYMLHGQELSLNDPVQLMKMLTEKNGIQQYPANQSAFSCPPVPSSVVQSLNRENSSNAAAGVDRSWMSKGSGGLRPNVDNMGLQRNQIPSESSYNAALAQQSQFSRFRGDFPAPLVYFQPGKNPFHGALQQPVRAGSAAQFHNQPMVVPQMSPADLSRFQAQSPWRNLSPPTQQAQKQGTCPPDLNVSFQSASSPGRPSPGVVVDSRQPDLALQL